MIQNKSLDPRYRINIEPGMRVMIETESENSKYVPCYVKEIITKDSMHESGIKVVCEDEKKGRVKFIGTETSFMIPMELIINLEKQLRDLVVVELSHDDPNWWNDKIHPDVKQRAEEKHSKNITKKKILQIPNYEMIQEIDFNDLLIILTGKKNWQNYFQKIFHDEKALYVKLDELSPYRNLPAHGKEVTMHIEKKIQVYYDDIVHLIEEYQRSKKD